MRRARMLSLLLWTSVGCGGNERVGHLPDAPPAGEPGIDLVTGGMIAFGDADCGTTPAPRTLTFKNTGTAPLSWSATIDGDGFAITGGASGEVAPGESAAISVAPEAIPSTAAVGQPIVAMLVVESNASDDTIAVQLAVTPHGGSLHVATAAIGFGQAQLTETLSEELEITNTGDRAIQLALGAPSNPDFTDAWAAAPAPAEVAPAASLAGAIAHFRPTTAAIENAVIAIAATGPVCAGDAPEIAVTGEGTTA
ncbi:MAG TPA: choice-of-anchor D domain-containing protein, partial [Kofleriaceae bacterium]|nr:choice-of-anchor D domain-containing protein [Kofleriaceae bacterium]